MAVTIRNINQQDELDALASTTSAELATVISDKTGTGVLVFANTPSLITPNIGVATATSVNGLTLTALGMGYSIAGGTISESLSVTASSTIDQNLQSSVVVGFKGLELNGSTGDGRVFFPAQSTINSVLSGGVSISSNASSQVVFATQAFQNAIFDFSSILGSAKTFTLPNQSGTLATTSMVPSIPVSAADGGTGITSYTIGDLIYASGATTLSKLTDVATGQVLVSGGVGVAPTYSATPTVTTLTGSTSLLSPIHDVSAAGALSLGTGTATSIAIGKSSITTTITGGLTQLTGAISLTGNTTSSITTSSGSLTLTSASSATWGTGAGALTLNGFGGVSLQLNGATLLDVGVTGSTAVTLAANKNFTAAAGSSAFSWGSATGATTLSTGNISWTGTNTSTLSLINTATSNVLDFTIGNLSTSNSSNFYIKGHNVRLQTDIGTDALWIINGSPTFYGSVASGGGTQNWNLGASGGAFTFPTGNITWTGGATNTLSLVTGGTSLIQSTGSANNVTIKSSGTSARVDVDGTAGVALYRSTTLVMDVGNTGASLVTLAGGVSLSFTAGAGGLSLGSGTGNTTFPTGSISWTAAASKSLSLAATTTATITSGTTATFYGSNITNLGTNLSTTNISGGNAINIQSGNGADLLVYSGQNLNLRSANNGAIIINSGFFNGGSDISFQITSAQVARISSTDGSFYLAAGKFLVLESGAGGLSLGNGTGAWTMPTGTGTVTSKSWLWTQGAATTSAANGFVYTGGAHTTLTASTEKSDWNWNGSRTVQFATGALTTQRQFLFQPATYGFVGASTLTSAATVAISGAPVAGTNATITNAYSLWIQAGTTRFDGAISSSGSGAVNFGSGTGDFTFPTGALSWTGASGKAANIYATSAALNIGTTTSGFVTLQGAQGTIFYRGASQLGDIGFTDSVGISLNAGVNFSTISAGAGNFDWSLSTGTFKTGTGAVSINGATTLAANKNFTAAAGTGAFSWGSATGDFTFSTGSVSWAGASGKIASLQSTAAGITIQSLTSGTVLIDSAAVLNLGTAAATTTNIGRTGQTTNLLGTVVLPSSTLVYQVANGFATGALGVVTAYLGAAGTTASATEINIGKCVRSGTARNLYFDLGVAPGGIDTVICTVRKNGVDTALTCTITGASLTASDTTNTFSVVAGDDFSIKVVSSGLLAATPTAAFEITN